MPENPVPVPLKRLATKYGTFFAAEGDSITWQLANYGAHTRNELAMVLQHIDPGDVIIDFGAHIGTFAVPMAVRAGSFGKVLAIEGSPETFAILERNIDANGLAGKVKPINAIVGQGPQQRLKRVDVGGNSGAGFYQPDPAAEHGANDALTLVTSHGFTQPHFIKIDIEGMELFVLRSLAPILSAHRPKLYVEVVGGQLARFGVTVAELDAFLRSFGYRFYRNTGERNSGHDRFEQTELATLAEGGNFFDLLALPG